MRKTILVLLVAGLSVVGCASIQGTVFKQKDGSYKATYSAKNERTALKVVHNDARTTCDGKDFVVIEQKVDKMTEDSEGKQEGFAAVAGAAVRAADKYFGDENVRATLAFECS